MAASPSPLCIAHVDAESDWSGGEVQVFLLMQGLRARGHRNLLVCPPASRAAAVARERGFECVEISMRNDLDLAAVAALWRAFARAAPDIVHLHTGRAAWLGGLAARLAGRRALVTRRMDRPVERGWRTQLLYRRLTRCVVAISPAVRAQLVAAGVPHERTRVIWSAVDPTALAARAGRELTRGAEGVGPDDLVLLTLASLVPRKGIDVLLDALAALGREELRPLVWIAGEGPELPALDEQARRAGVRDQVRFLKQRRDVADLLLACDVFVQPSRAEGLGVAALEAMALGRPVVASRVGGLAEAVVAGRAGLLVDPGDSAELAVALARVLRDPVLRERLGQEGPKRLAEGFLAEQMVESYERLYGELANAAR